MSIHTPKSVPLFSPSIIKDAIPLAIKKLNPRTLSKNPVMFVVGIGSMVTTVAFISDLYLARWKDAVFSGQISLWLWFTLLCANFAESVAEGRGKAQAETLKKARKDTPANIRGKDGKVQVIPSNQLKKGDVVIVSAGQVIPADGTVIDGAAAVDESAITGESAPVIRESGGDRSAVTGGTTVLSDQLVIEITTEPGRSFLDRMIALVEGAERLKTPNEIALNILLAGLTIVFLLAVVTLKPFAQFHSTQVSVVILVALLVCLIPTTIGGLLSAIGIAGIDRLLVRNVLAMSGRAVEAAGDVDVLLLDKTGTITIGNRMATAFMPAPTVGSDRLIQCAALSSLADLTPEGRSIVTLAAQQGFRETMPPGGVSIPFTAETRMSGIMLSDGKSIRKGSIDAIKKWLAQETESWILPFFKMFVESPPTGERRLL